jgi:hypothetical protein
MAAVECCRGAIHALHTGACHGEKRTSMSNNRVVVGVTGSDGSLAALSRAAEEARRRGAVLASIFHCGGGVILCP